MTNQDIEDGNFENMEIQVHLNIFVLYGHILDDPTTACKKA
jgi:hypothetical protein